MRRCVFVIGSVEQLRAAVPILKMASEAGLRYGIWFAQATESDAAELAASLGLKVSFPSAKRHAGRAGLGGAIGCYEHVHSLKAWTRRPPLVIVFGDSVSSYLAMIAGRLAGGWIVDLEGGHYTGSLGAEFPLGLLRSLRARLTNFAVCSGDDAERRMRKYHCKILRIDGALPGAVAARQATVDALLSWAR